MLEIASTEILYFKICGDPESVYCADINTIFVLY